MTKTELERRLSKAMIAIRLADSIMAYCQGDRWERECTAKDRARFCKLYKQLTGKEPDA